VIAAVLAEEELLDTRVLTGGTVPPFFKTIFLSSVIVVGVVIGVVEASEESLIYLVGLFLIELVGIE